MQIIGSGKLEGLYGFVIFRKTFTIAFVCNSQDNPLKIVYSAHMHKLKRETLIMLAHLEYTLMIWIAAFKISTSVRIIGPLFLVSNLTLR